VDLPLGVLGGSRVEVEGQSGAKEGNADVDDERAQLHDEQNVSVAN
jgi:hypothetical protein